MNDYRLVEVRLPAELVEGAEQRFGPRFGGIDQFLTFVLRELLREDAAEADQEEERMLEERLKNLGYI